MTLERILAAVLAASLAPCAAQTPESPAPLPQLEHLDQGRGLQRDAGRLVGFGSRYSADFAPDHVEFTPALGSGAPHNLPLTLRTRAIGRRFGDLMEVRSTEPVAESERVEYRRAICTERYDVGVDGLEQSFVFKSRPVGEGDLVVRIDVDTRLEQHALTKDGGVRFFTPELGGVTVGAVTGISADGARVRGDVTFDGAVIELSLPAEFVETAELPFVLDPLISAQIPIRDTAFREFSVDLAFDANTDKFLCVWARSNSASDIDIYARLLDADGTPASISILAIETGAGYDTWPKVANIAQHDAFVVIWSSELTEVHARGYSVANFLTNTITVTTDVQPGNEHDIGGESTNVDNDAICVWASRSTRSVFGTQIQLLGGTTLSSFGTTALSSSPHYDLEPSISKTGGATGRFAVAFTRLLPTRWAIRAVVVDRNLNVLDNFIDVSGTDFHHQSPDVDGDGTRWVVAFEKSELPDVGFASGASADVVCRPLHWNEADGGVDPGPTVIWVEADPSDNEHNPEVAHLGESVAIVYADRLGTAEHVYVRQLEPRQCFVCEGTDSLYLGNEIGVPAICAKRSVVPGSSDALIAYALQTQTSGNLFGNLYTAEDGVTIELGGGCGQGGRAVAGCATTDNTGFEMQLRDAAPDTGAYLLLGLAPLDVPCGSCTLHLQPVLNYLTLTDASGYAGIGISIPSIAGAVELELRQQWVVLSGSACPLVGVDFSSAIVSRLQ